MITEQKPQSIPHPKAKLTRKIYCDCGYIASSQDEFMTHKQSHKNGTNVTVTPLVNPVTGEPDKPIEDTPAEIEPPKVTVPPVVPPKQETPIDLQYIYTGTCPTCNRAVETVPIKNIPEGKMTIIAWCAHEKKNIQQRIVAKI